MLLGIGNYKGGTAKTTTAVHLATFLQKLGPTLLIDGDGIRSATKWSQRGTGHGLPFKVVSHAQMAKFIKDYEHVVIDTEGNPNDDDIRDLAGSCDLLVVPAVPESVATDGLTHTLEMLRKLGNENYKVLLTMVPPPPRSEGKLLRQMLEQEGIPVFKSEIPRLAAFEKAAAEAAGPKFGALAQLRTSKPEPEGEAPSLPVSAPRNPFQFFLSQPDRLAVLLVSGATPNGTTPISCYASRRRSWPIASWKMREQTKISPNSWNAFLACICAGKFHSSARSELCTPPLQTWQLEPDDRRQNRRRSKSWDETMR